MHIICFHFKTVPMVTTVGQKCDHGSKFVCLGVINVCTFFHAFTPKWTNLAAIATSGRCRDSHSIQLNLELTTPNRPYWHPFWINISQRYSWSRADIVEKNCLKMREFNFLSATVFCMATILAAILKKSWQGRSQDWAHVSPRKPPWKSVAV